MKMTGDSSMRIDEIADFRVQISDLELQIRIADSVDVVFMPTFRNPLVLKSRLRRNRQFKSEIQI